MQFLSLENPRASLLPALLALGFTLSTSAVRAQEIRLDSPARNIQVTINPSSAAGLTYRVQFQGQTALAPSPLGISVNGENLGQSAVAGKVTTRAKKETYPVWGVHRTALNSYREVLVPMQSSASKTPWQLEVRAFNDGVAYRYRVPGQGSRQINGEASTWNLPAGGTYWYQTNANEYEGLFLEKTAEQIPAGIKVGAPVTVKLANGLGYAMLTEANLVGYSDMALVAGQPGSFNALFDKNAQGWSNEGEIVSPWRVTLLANNLNTLVNSDIVRNLCPPPAPELANASWIRPGRALWHWMVTGRPKLEEQTQWVNWTKEIGFEYYLIDDGWKDWKAEGKNQWACLKEVVDYAKTQGVGIFAWVNSNEIFSESDRAAYLQKAKAAGVVGLKIDFPRAANPVWVKWYDDTLRDTAKAQLMIDFHGAVKPTGRDRTWPHELTREAIRGREMFKLPSLHDAALPFTRFVQGNADFTPTEYRSNKIGRSSWAHELAQAVLYTSPFLCYSGSPESYLTNPALDIMRAIPATWDETIVLPGNEIGQMAAFARRRGDEWFIAGINGGISNGNSGVATEPNPQVKYPSISRTLNVALGFLKKGNYRLDLLTDANESRTAWQRNQYSVTRNNKLAITMRPDGGFVARLTKVQ